MRVLWSIAFAGAWFAACWPAVAQPPAASPARVLTTAAAADPYAPYAFLIGDWYSSPPGEGPSIHQRFRWGTKRSFIYYTILTAEAGKAEEVHFEGMFVWNGASGALDYVVTLVPGSGGQEKGVMRLAEDGAIVRDVTMTDREGKVATFRQTFRRTGPDSAVTSLMRRTADGWEPNFPGSDRIEMRRRNPA
jgi:hypothetical protein